MLVVGLQGSPRKKGNTNYLLSVFLQEAERLGARTITLDVPRMNIGPCRELVVCEKKGYCPIDDEMKTDVYSLLWDADVIAVASPIFFYNVTSQLKALIEHAKKNRIRIIFVKEKIEDAHHSPTFAGSAWGIAFWDLRSGFSPRICWACFW